jgi:hypothetical protein
VSAKAVAVGQVDMRERTLCSILEAIGVWRGLGWGFNRRLWANFSDWSVYKSGGFEFVLMPTPHAAEDLISSTIESLRTRLTRLETLSDFQSKRMFDRMTQVYHYLLRDKSFTRLLAEADATVHAPEQEADNSYYIRLDTSHQVIFIECDPSSTPYTFIVKYQQARRFRRATYASEEELAEGLVPLLTVPLSGLPQPRVPLPGLLQPRVPATKSMLDRLTEVYHYLQRDKSFMRLLADADVNMDAPVQEDNDQYINLDTPHQHLFIHCDPSSNPYTFIVKYQQQRRFKRATFASEEELAEGLVPLLRMPATKSVPATKSMFDTLTEVYHYLQRDKSFMRRLAEDNVKMGAPVQDDNDPYIKLDTPHQQLFIHCDPSSKPYTFIVKYQQTRRFKLARYATEEELAKGLVPLFSMPVR